MPAYHFAGPCLESRPGQSACSSPSCICSLPGCRGTGCPGGLGGHTVRGSLTLARVPWSLVLTCHMVNGSEMSTAATRSYTVYTHFYFQNIISEAHEGVCWCNLKFLQNFERSYFLLLHFFSNADISFNLQLFMRLKRPNGRFFFHIYVIRTLTSVFFV